MFFPIVIPIHEHAENCIEKSGKIFCEQGDFSIQTLGIFASLWLILLILIAWSLAENRLFTALALTFTPFILMIIFGG